MNTRSKGMRNERKAVKELEADGWLTYRVKGSTIFNRNVDIFGLWDILAIKNKTSTMLDENWTAIKLIQVKTNQKPPLKPFKTFIRKYPGLDCEIWIYKDRKEKEVIVL